MWTVIASVGGRAVGVVGTLVLARFLHPEVLGEVSDAAILCVTANIATVWGFGQYAVVKGRGDERAEVMWHATVFYVALGVLALGLVALFGGGLTGVLGAPHAAVYVPAMALAVFIRRLGAMPERVLTQQMKFGPSGMALAAGEASFAATAVPLAALGWGGWALIVANLVKSCVAVAILVSAAGVASWATPARLRMARVKDMLRYGLPLGAQGIAGTASRYWDNLAVSYYFGPAPLGAYNLAYNLADIPAIQVGEQIALVLLPSMAALPSEKRPRALERSAALLSLIIFPLAIGLGVVSYPLIAWILPAGPWQEVAPLLTVLACLSVFRPITWVLSAYMEAEQRTGRLFMLEVAKVGVLLAGFALLAPYGMRAAAGAVGIAFGVTAVAGVALVVRHGPSPRRLASAFLRPLAACAAMVVAVWLVGRGLDRFGGVHPAIYVALEIGAGALVYVATALVVCRATALDLLQLVRRAFGR